MATENDAVTSAGSTSAPLVPLTREERLELANRLFREFHTRCFWHCPRDLVITEDLLPLVVKGLRQHGGRRGFILSGKLRQKRTDHPIPEGEAQEGP
jgi:hypothetical protein